MGLIWCCCSLLAARDLLLVALDSPGGVSFMLASLTLCVFRAGTAFGSAEAALGRRTRLFFVTSALALGHDLALATLPLPCSESRADDVTFALAGATVQTALLLGFLFSLWMRRGLSESVDDATPPAA
jgi:hypothetical protein